MGTLEQFCKEHGLEEGTYALEKDGKFTRILATGKNMANYVHDPIHKYPNWINNKATCDALTAPEIVTTMTKRGLTIVFVGKKVAAISPVAFSLAYRIARAAMNGGVEPVLAEIKSNVRDYKTPVVYLWKPVVKEPVAQSRDEVTAKILASLPKPPASNRTGRTATVTVTARSADKK